MESVATRKQRVLGVYSTHSHSSEAQVQNLLEVTEGMCQTYNSLPSFKSSEPATNDELFRKVTGVISDHAEDQKKKFRLIFELKTALWTTKLGSDALAELSEDELANLMADELRRSHDAAGSREAWLKLSEDDQAKILTESRDALKADLASAAFDALCPEDRSSIRLCVWTGCAAHKMMNLFKAGCKKMGESWALNGLTPPVLLPNKDNDAVISSTDVDPGYGDVERRAVAISEGGGVKTISLAGGIFNHKDSKKGHHDTYRAALCAQTGSFTVFADVSNMRFGSFGDGAGEVMLYLDWHIQYLEDHAYSKTKVGLTHMEANLLKGLRDPATQQELMVMAIFSECVFHPYLQHVRSGDKGLATNMLDEAPWHLRLKEYLESVISDPDLILGETATFETATLDGKRFHNANVMGSIFNRASPLATPHLRMCLIAFFQGALEKLPSFTTEFTSGEIDKLIDAERKLSFCMQTNDVNESMFGLYCTYDWKNPSGSLLLYNSIQMNKLNETEQWRENHLTEADDAALRKGARDIDAQHLEKERRKEINHARTEKIAEQKKAEKERTDRANAKEAKIARIQRIYDPLWLHLKTTTLEPLNDQIKAWKVIDPLLKVPSRALKPQKIELLEEAMIRWKATHPDVSGSTEILQASQPT